MSTSPDAFTGTNFHHLRGRYPGFAERRVEEIVARHGGEAGVHLSHLAGPDPVHSCLHVVVDAPPGDPAEHAEGVVMSVEQHLVGLQRVRPHNEGPAVRQLGMGDLQFDALAAQNRPVLAPVELERLARREDQRHERTAPGRLLLRLTVRLPASDEGRDPAVRA